MTHMDGWTSARRGIAAHLVEIPPKVNKGRKSTCCHSSKSLFVSQYYIRNKERKSSCRPKRVGTSRYAYLYCTE